VLNGGVSLLAMPYSDSTESVPALPSTSEGWRLAPGALVDDRYEVRGYLGRGGHGTVYRVFDRAIGRENALKLLDPERGNLNGIARLRREVRVARDAESPRLVRIFDLGTSPQGTYLTMELIDGPSLKDMLRRRLLPITDSVRIATHLFEGLAALHRLQIVHRDVKPGNVLLVGGSDAKLADFGLARRLDREETQLTLPDGLVGTLAYLAPEQVLGRDGSEKSDLYAAGLVLFEMLAGRLPHEAGGSDFERRLSVLDRAPDVRRFRPEVPPWLARVVARLLEVRLAHRYREAEEVLRDLTRERSPRRVRLRRWLLRVAAVLFLVLPPTGVVLQPAAEASFSHLVPLEGEGIAAVGTRGEKLWKLRGVDQETSTKWVLARTTPGGPRLLALVPARPGRFSPENVSTLAFLDPATGRVIRQVKLPSGADRFPHDPPRFAVASVKSLDLLHDGTDEIIVSYRHVPEAPSYAVLYAPRLNQARVIYYARGGQEFEGTADLDHDGVPELLFAGIDNGWNWVNVVAAVKLDPGALREGDSLTTPAAPDVMDLPSQARMLLWYAVVPRGYMEDAHRLTIDKERRELAVHYLSGKTWTLDFDGFSPGTPGAERAERQEARRATYEHFREAERLRTARQLELAMSEAKAALDSARRAREEWLSQYAERLQAKILVEEKQIPEAEARFASLMARAEDAPEVAYDAAVAFHLAGDLHRAVTWYERGIGRGSAMGAGKSKHEFLKGEVLALVEEKRYEDALAAVDRFGAAYPPFEDHLWSFREYIRWRAGERPEAHPSRVQPNHTDLFRYWELEFEFAGGGEPQEILSRVDRFLAERPETTAEALSLRAELLARLGRGRDAAEAAQSALELVRGEAPRSIIARGHAVLVEERARRLRLGFFKASGSGDRSAAS
jgi:tetratricopeptide (TPR) repeat protein